jgi:hypothetical protein
LRETENLKMKKSEHESKQKQKKIMKSFEGLTLECNIKFGSKIFSMISSFLGPFEILQVGMLGTPYNSFI